MRQVTHFSGETKIGSVEHDERTYDGGSYNLSIEDIEGRAEARRVAARADVEEQLASGKGPLMDAVVDHLLESRALDHAIALMVAGKREEWQTVLDISVEQEVEWLIERVAEGETWRLG
jgi:hypothetical protein